MKKDDYIHARISSDLKKAAQQHAKDTGRTLAGLIEWLLRQELKKNGIAERQKGREDIMLNRLKKELSGNIYTLCELDNLVIGILENSGIQSKSLFDYDVREDVLKYGSFAWGTEDGQIGVYNIYMDITKDSDDLLNIEVKVTDIEKI